MSQSVRAIFVAWQDPTQRRFYPVARLAHIAGDGVGEIYEFAYIEGAREAQKQGFQPFLAFSELERIYRSRQLFPLFANRVMSATRTDYPQYVERLALPETSSAVEVLARSGGRRTTDTVELFPMPLPDTEMETYTTYFLAHGVRYLPGASHDRIATLHPSDSLLLMLDCQNPYDPEAIALRTEDRMIVGYMPNYLLDDAHDLLKQCGYIDLFVEKVNPPPAPIQQRLLCRMESCWPKGFVPFSTNRYQPLPREATKLSPSMLLPREAAQRIAEVQR